MAGEPFDVAGGAGEASQEREFYIRKIVELYPERAADPTLLYGNPKLEYLRLVNDGLIETIPPNIVTAKITEHGSILYLNGVEL